MTGEGCDDPAGGPGSAPRVLEHSRAHALIAPICIFSKSVVKHEHKTVICSWLHKCYLLNRRDGKFPLWRSHTLIILRKPADKTSESAAY